MDHREKLRDRYEDALFALLMDEIAEKEGARAREENEQLKNDPTAAVPEDVDRRCLQTIRRHFIKQNARIAGRYTVKAVKYVLLAAGLAVMMFATAFATSETVRVNTKNLLIKVLEDRTVFEFEQKIAANPVPQFDAGWMPDGYELIDQNSDFSGVWFQYQRSEDELIGFGYTIAEGSSISVDTEDAETEYVKIHGTQAMLISKNGSLQLIWATEDHTAFIEIIGEGATREDILHVANQLTY